MGTKKSKKEEKNKKIATDNNRTKNADGKAKPKKKRGKKILLTVLLVIVLLIAGAAVMAFLNIKPPSLDNHIGEDTEEISRTDGVYSVLVVGTDKVGLNTDTIMVASLDTVNNRASLMSIPRDTMSNVNRNVKKINAAYASGAKNGKGNIDQLKKEVSALMGFEIDNYVVVNLVAFEELIDAVGGVTIDVPRNMNYDDPYQDLHIHIDKGLQTLNGEQAIGFVRYRSGYVNGDIGRVQAQQMFIEALVDQVATPSIVTKMPKLIDIVLDNTDTDLTNGELIWFGKEALEVDTENDFNMFVLPGEAQYVNKISYYLPNEEEILKVVNEYFNPNETPITDLDVVDLAAIRQKEAARQATLTEEQRRKEEALREQMENSTIILDPNGVPVENPGVSGEVVDPSTVNPSGTEGNETIPGAIPGEVLPEQNPPATEPSPQPPAGTEVQPVAPETTYTTIPGEVLKQDTVQ